MTSPSRYIAQIEGMTTKGRVWLEAHPNAEVELRFNFAADALVIAPISTAVKSGLVSVNKDRAALLEAMQEGIEPRFESTVTMVRVAFETIWEGGPKA